METVLVSIISDQTIPNLLLIKELEGKYSDQVFISTKKMEEAGKSCWIEKAAGIEPGTIQRIVVDENNWNDIKEKLVNFNWSENSGYVVNLTGGTKVMTLAVYEHFSKPGNRIIYSAIGRNSFEELFPIRNPGSVPIKYRLSLKEYLSVHGLFYKTDDRLLYSEEHTLAYFETFKSKHFRFRLQPEIMEAQKADSVTDKQYYSGRWFEEFVYIFLKRELGLNKEQIALNMKLSRKDDHKQHDNEYDVVFTMNNALYVIECKASLGSEKTLKAKIEKSLYKLGAVTRDFGLRVNSYIFTLSHINITGKVSYLNIQKRKEILGIKEIFDAPYFYNINEIINHFKQ